METFLKLQLRSLSSARDLLILDLDGTLLDIRARHYAAHTYAMGVLGREPLAPDRYWRQVRRGNARWTDMGGAEAIKYRDAFVERIECEELLALDRVYPRVPAWLDGLASDDWECVVVTARRIPSRAHAQVGRLLMANFDLIVLGGPDKSADVVARYDLGRAVAWVGDTEADIEAARRVAIPAIAVTSGLRSPSFLRALQPDYVHRRVTDIEPARLRDITHKGP